MSVSLTNTKLPSPPLLSRDVVTRECYKWEIIVTFLGDIEKKILQCIADHLEMTFHYRVKIAPAVDIPRMAYDGEKKQYDPDMLVNAVWNQYGCDSPHVLAVTNVDLKDPKGKWRYCWAWGWQGSGCQLVSLYRLQTEEESRFMHRLLVVSQKRMAHTFGIPANNDEFNFAYSQAYHPALLDTMSLELNPYQKEQSEFIRRYESELLPPISDNIFAQLEKDSLSKKWVPSMLYAWALIEHASRGFSKPPDEKYFKLAEDILRRMAYQKAGEGFARLGLAFIYEESGKRKISVTELEKSRAANHTVNGIFYHIGLAALRSGNLERASIMLEREYFINGIYSDSAHTYHKKSYLNRAIMTKRPYLFNLPLAIACNLYNLGYHDKAAEVLKDILTGVAYLPGRRHAWLAHNLLAWIYTDKLRTNFEDAIRHATVAISLNPKSGAALDTLGWTYYKMDNYKKALPLLQKAAKLDADPKIKEHIRIVRDVLKRRPIIS